MKFDNAYYEEVAKRYNYDFCDKSTNVLPNLTHDEQSRWLCGYNLDKIQDADSTFVTLGVGINREPHIGTISQILRGIFLQKRGYNVQIVLGDLDSYNSRDSSLSYVRRNVENYKNFIISLGFNEKTGIIRGQIDHPEIMRTAFVIASKVKDRDFYDVEERLSAYYQKLGIYDGVTFPLKQAVLLMFSDFIHGIFTEEYSNVLVLSGIDEHTYVPKTDEIAHRIGLSGNISGLFSPIVSGLNGQPKMSKSLRGSGITADMSEGEIAKIIMQPPDGKCTDNDIAIYQAMDALLIYDKCRMDELNHIMIHDSQSWKTAKEKFAYDVFQICKNWNAQ